ncbi:hypothetical protein M9458_052210 [Cirrhinus mrigala]|uniref:Uncharacterized protein n=1 Tax=Cirrhinus mrigala TaxID=683832 RepID=A0ABD0MUM8_CIRMR
MGETRAPNIRRPRRTTAGTTAAPTQKRAEEGPEEDHPAATMQTSQGAVAASPQAPPAPGHTRADRALGPVIQGPPTPQPGPSKARGARPRPATTESGPALTRASCPGARNQQRTGGRGHPPPRGNQRQTPELDPLHSGVETGRPPRSPAAAEKTTSPDPDRMASSSSQPPAPDREQRTENREQGHPRCPKSAQGRGPRPIQTRAHGSPGRPTRPHSRGKNYPHPIIQSTPRLQKEIDTQLKRPPDPPTRQRPPHQGRAQAHAPTHTPGGTPSRTQAPQAQPESQPGGRAAPEPQAPHRTVTPTHTR